MPDGWMDGDRRTPTLSWPSFPTLILAGGRHTLPRRHLAFRLRDRTTVSDFYWRSVSPLLRDGRTRIVIIALLTVLFVFGPAYLPDGPLTLNVVP